MWRGTAGARGLRGPWHGGRAALRTHAPATAIPNRSSPRRLGGVQRFNFKFTLSASRRGGTVVAGTSVVTHTQCSSFDVSHTHTPSRNMGILVTDSRVGGHPQHSPSAGGPSQGWSEGSDTLDAPGLTHARPRARLHGKLTTRWMTRERRHGVRRPRRRRPEGLAGVVARGRALRRHARPRGVVSPFDARAQPRRVVQQQRLRAGAGTACCGGRPVGRRQRRLLWPAQPHAPKLSKCPGTAPVRWTVDVRVGVRVCACFDCDGCAR